MLTRKKERKERKKTSKQASKKESKQEGRKGKKERKADPHMAGALLRQFLQASISRREQESKNRSQKRYGKTAALVRKYCRQVRLEMLL